MSAQMKLPANHTALHEDEMMYTTGGAAVDTVARAVVAVGGAAALLVVGGVAARAILSVFGGAGRPGRRHRGQRRRRPELHRRRAGRRPELPEQPDGPVKRPFRTNCRPLPALLHSVKKVPAGHVVQPGPFLVCLARGRLASGFRNGGADQWVPFAGASIFSSRMSSMQMRCSWVIGSFATAPIEMLRTACSSVGQFIWKVTA